MKQRRRYLVASSFIDRRDDPQVDGIGIAAIYRRPNTSKPAPGDKIYPYLLRGVKIERADQVWAMDISVPQQAA